MQINSSQLDVLYSGIEEWLEDVYRGYPFNRIFKDGKRMGYEGFVDRFDLSVEKAGVCTVSVKVINKTTQAVSHEQTFFY